MHKKHFSFDRGQTVQTPEGEGVVTQRACLPDGTQMFGVRVGHVTRSYDKKQLSVVTDAKQGKTVVPTARLSGDD